MLLFLNKNIRLMDDYTISLEVTLYNFIVYRLFTLITNTINNNTDACMQISTLGISICIGEKQF